ncbi:DUF4913 domain-containing protein [Streptomyces sp. NPDC005900]|uniref:DUF4913 domain-containing protein n=1 Tax=Streptomyces sp. NPDC005900 TaxID=3154569 RepID=UPI0033ED7D08
MSTITDEWGDTDTPNDGEPSPSIEEPKSKKKTSPKEPPPLVFSSVEEFVREWLAPTVRRNLAGKSLTWCPSWWRHPEGLSRLTAMWRAWENLRLDPALGISTWWLHHGDPHLRVLMDREVGPFASCKPEGHTSRPYPPLPHEEADPSLWLHPAFSSEAHKGT